VESDIIPFSAIRHRPRLSWPNGARVALWICPNIEHYEFLAAFERTRAPWPRSPAPDVLGYSIREYGNRIGIFRVLDALDAAGIVPNVALGAEAARRMPELVDECARRGATFLGHGTHATRRITSRMSIDEQRALIGESRAAVLRATGVAPLGWCGQDFNESPDTPTLLHEAGFTYTTDWSNDDRPYRLGRLVSLPAHSEWNDLECMWLRRVSPRIWADGIAEGFAVLHAEGRAVFNLTLHPWIAGQAHRIAYLRTALARVLGKPDVWRASLDDLALRAEEQV
jgi:peptidoglycan/xylan/chitin deacetylase (PgdA/CDA1 family)